VPKPEWGTKRICQSCGAKFYDMTHTPIICPKCETVFEVETKARKTRAPRVEEVVAKPVVVVKDDDEIDVDDVEDVEDDDDETDAALLPDDDEDEDDLNDVGIAGTPGDDDEDT
jgi:uncharacterized protein (TIGR02300 family)